MAMIGGSKHHTGTRLGHKKAAQLLKDMRAVYDNKPVKGEGRNEAPGVKALRKMLLDNPVAFMTKLEKMEERYKASQPTYSELGEATPETAVADEGSERVIELVDRWLKENGNERPGLGKQDPAQERLEPSGRNGEYEDA